jgi:Fe2+ or Zn2+ uptake regulation protein
MSATTEQPQIDQRLATALRERHLRVTSQRLLVHRTLCSRVQHMTAEQVLNAVSESLPGISLPTVYATLELLERLGLVRRLATGTGAVLFDSRVEQHAHTVCRRCGATADLDGARAPSSVLARASDAGFAPDHAQLVVWGLCPGCAADVGKDHVAHAAPARAA